MENLDIILKVIIVYSIILTWALIYKENSAYTTGADIIDYVVAGPITWIGVLLCLIVAHCDFIGKPVIKLFDYIDKKRASKTYNVNEAEFIVKLVIWLAKRDKHKSKEWYKLSSSHVYYSSFYGWENLMTKRAPWERLNKHFSRLMSNQHHLGMQALSKYLKPIEKSDLLKCDEYWAEQYNLGEYGVIYKFK